MDENLLIEFDDFLENIDNIPSLKPVPTKILKLLKDENTEVKKLAELISRDPSLAANILKYANSSFLGFKQKITSIPQIISLIGIREIKKLTLIYAIKSRVEKDLKGYGLTGKQIWKHSLSAAIGAQFLAQLKGIYPTENAFTSGFLVDIGKIVLNDFIIKRNIKAIKDRENVYKFHKIEREFFGIDHSEIGALLLKKWDFPEEVIISIRHHHRPSESPKYKKLTSALHIADLVSTASIFELDVNEYETRIDHYALKSLKIKFHDLKELVDLMIEEIENAEKEFF